MGGVVRRRSGERGQRPPRVTRIAFVLRNEFVHSWSYSVAGGAVEGEESGGGEPDPRERAESAFISGAELCGRVSRFSLNPPGLVCASLVNRHAFSPGECATS